MLKNMTLTKFEDYIKGKTRYIYIYNTTMEKKLSGAMIKAMMKS